MHEEENSIKYLLLIIGFLLLFLIIVFFYYVLKYHKKSVKLYEEKLNAEMTGREEERKRISKDLHDELGATITGAKMYLEGFQGNSEQEKLSVSKAHASISKCLDLIKQIMNDLYPISLDNYGLISCLNELIEEINQTERINIIFSNTVEDFEIKILKEHKIHLFRIIKEIIQNTLKHSESKVLSIRFTESKDSIIMDTIDQGLGFDGNDNAFRYKGHGMKNIINRVELIGAAIFLDARQKKGVHYTIEIPITNATSKNQNCNS